MSKELPNEIWANILLFCDDRPTWISALTVNSALHDAAGKILYRDLRTDDVSNFFSGANLPQYRNTKSPLLQHVRALHLMLRSYKNMTQNIDDEEWVATTISPAPGPPAMDQRIEHSRINLLSANPPNDLPKLDTLVLEYTRGERRPDWWLKQRNETRPTHDCTPGLANHLVNRCTPKYVCSNPEDTPLALTHRPLEHSPDIITWHVTSYSPTDITWVWGSINRIYLLHTFRGPYYRSESVPEYDQDWLRAAFRDVKPAKIGDKKTRFEIYLRMPMNHGCYGCSDEQVRSNRRHLVREIRELLAAQTIITKGAKKYANSRLRKEEAVINLNKEELEAVEVSVKEWDARPKCPSCGDESVPRFRCRRFVQ